MWSVSLRVDTASVEAFSDLMSDNAVSVSTFEVLDEDGRQIGDAWQIDLLCPSKPKTGDLTAQLALIAASKGVAEPSFTVTEVPDTDWVTATLSSFPPIQAGRFWVHGTHDAGSCPPGLFPLCIDAATAFGTGEHPTTRGCLIALDALAKQSSINRLVATRGPIATLDVGCGTGILAMAMARLWPGRVLASDIDPEAVRVARLTARANGLHLRLKFVEADGVGLRSVTGSAPFAVITANILARPLCQMADGLTDLLSPSGRLVLSGLLVTQIPMVLNVYRAQGLALERTYDIGEWATLVLSRSSQPRPSTTTLKHAP